MKTRTLILLFIPVLLASGCGGGKKWAEYTSPEGRFSVLAYGTPKTDEVGPSFHRIAFAPQKDVFYTVAYGDLTLDAEKLKQPEFVDKHVFDSCSALIGKLNGKLIEGKNLNLDGVPGREILVEVPEKGFHRIRVYQAKNRYYQVEVNAPSKEAVTSEEANKFFDSFKITG